MSEWLNAFSPDGKQIMMNAVNEAQALNHGYVGTEHIFFGMMDLENGVTNTTLQKMGIEGTQLRQKIKEYVGTGYVGAAESLPKDKLSLTPRTIKVIELSMNEAKRLGLELVEEIHVLLSLISEGKGVPIRMLREMNVDPNEMKSVAMEICSSTKELAGDPNIPILSKYGRNLTQLAAEGKLEPAIGRDREMSEVTEILGQRKKNNPLLLGEAGVGKTAIVEGLAFLMASGKVSEDLRKKRIIELSMGSLVAGTMYRGQFEERLMGMIKEVRSNRDIIIFIDEIHTLMGAGGAEGAVDAANMMKTALGAGELHCIGATTYNEYEQYIKKTPPWIGAFRPS